MGRHNHVNVIEEHIALLEEMNVRWSDVEFGAPEIDPKRPYGNSGVLADMRAIVDDEYDDKQLRSLHQDMDVILEIMIDTKQVSVGEYERSDDGSWESIDRGDEYIGDGPQTGLEENSTADELFPDNITDDSYEVRWQYSQRDFMEEETARAFADGLEAAGLSTEVFELSKVDGESNE